MTTNTDVLLPPATSGAQHYLVSEMRTTQPVPQLGMSIPLHDSDRQRHIDYRATMRHEIANADQVDVEFTVDKCANLLLPSGEIVGRGLHVRRMFRDEWEVMQRELVADEQEPGRVAAAREEFNRRIGKELKRELEKLNHARWNTVPAADIAKLATVNDGMGPDDEEFQRVYRKLGTTCPQSPEAAYHSMFETSPKPISSARIVATHGPAQSTAAARTRDLASTVASAVASARSESAITPDSLAAALVAALKEAGLTGKGK